MRRGIVAVAGVAAVVVSGCGAAGNLFTTSDETDDIRLAKVIVLAPTSGPPAAAARGVAAAVELALADLSADGWEAVVEHIDDGVRGGDPTATAEKVAADPDVIAVVGGLSGAAVRAAQPHLDRALIPFISPADDDAAHTRGADPLAPQRPYELYFRTAVPGGDPQRVAAEYAVFGLDAATVQVVTEDGPSAAAGFVNRARRLGADVAVSPPGDVDSAVADAKQAAASAVFVAGGGEFAARVAQEATAAGLEALLIGAAGQWGDEFLAGAGAVAAGSVAVVPATLEPSGGLPVPELADAGEFGAAAYDAGTALAAVLARCLPAARDDAEAARQGCGSELGGISFHGLTGLVSFDEFGERPGALPQVFVVTDGEWRETGEASS
jgi:branched-chain amino acid transport system substrate-binding protein